MPFVVTMMLADAAQSVAGKLYILGGGWSVMGLPAHPMAIALHVRVPWDRANERHKMVLELVDLDGREVFIDEEQGSPAPRFENDFEVGRPAGIKPGTSLDLAMALNFGALQLQPGGYVWRLSIDGESDETWRLPFTVTLTAPRPAA